MKITTKEGIARPSVTERRNPCGSMGIRSWPRRKDCGAPIFAFASGNRSARGAVLLEVILALVLFVAAATIIGAGIHSAMDGVERQKLNAHAVNLAVSVVSEIQMGLRTVESVGPEPFDSPFDHWTWQLVLAPTETEAGESSDLTRVEVIVRHDDPALVHRLTQVLKLEKKSSPAITAALFPR